VGKDGPEVDRGGEENVVGRTGLGGLRDFTKCMVMMIATVLVRCGYKSGVIFL